MQTSPHPDDLVAPWIIALVEDRRNARADLPSVNDQRIDYRRKLETVATAFAQMEARPMRVGDLFGPQVKQLIATRRNAATGQPVRPATRNAYRRTVNAFIGWLEERGLTLPPKPRLRLEKTGASALRVFDADSLERIFAHLAAHDTIPNRRLAAIIALGLDIGARRCDALSLRLSKLDLDDRWAELWVKNDKHPKVPLGEIAVRALRRYLEVRVDQGNHDLVFLDQRGGRPVTGDSVTKQMRRLLLELGMVQPAAERMRDDVALEPERLNLQALRRTFVRHYVRAGRTERELAAIVGWTPEYAHVVHPAYSEVEYDDLARVHADSSPLNRLLGGDD